MVAAQGKTVRLITVLHRGKQEIGAFVSPNTQESGAQANDSQVVRLQAAAKLQSSQIHPHLDTMLAFLQGGPQARDDAQAALDFACSQRPEGVLLDRSEVQLLSPLPRPESIRDFMVF